MKDNVFNFISTFLKYTVFLVISFFLVNCNEKTNRDLSYQIQVDTVKIDISSKFLDYYINYDILDEPNLYVGYSHFDHALHFIDLKNKETLYTIELATDGPNKIKTIGELFITEDKIFLKATPEWIIMDHKGKILERITYSDFAEDLDNKYIINGGLTISYLQKKELSSDHKSVFMRLFPATAGWNSPEIYEHPLFCKLEFQKKTVTIDPYLPYPEIFRLGLNYGILDKPSIIPLEDRLIYSFPNHSTIYVYHFNESTISSNEVVSEKIKSIIEVSQNGDWEHIVRSSFASNRYHPIHYDQFRDLYYRVIRVKNDIQDVNEYYLQIIDNQFKVIDELLLPSEKVDRNTFKVTREGVFFQLMSSRGNIFSYMYIDVQVEE